MSEIYFVRHAPTASNINKIFMGQLPVPIEPVANSEQYQIKPETSYRVFCSPLLRATMSAEILFPNDTPIIDPRLPERHAGHWQGLPLTEVIERWPAHFIGENIAPNAEPPGGESKHEFQTRVKSFLTELIGQNIQKTSYIVTHNGWIRMAQMLNGEVAADQIFSEQIPHLTPILFTPKLLLQQI